MAVALVLLFRYPLNTALTVGASLAQIGEFSFILAGLGVALELMPREGQSLVLAGALISIALNASLFSVVEPLRRWILARSAFARQLEMRDDPLAELPAEQKPLLYLAMSFMEAAMAVEAFHQPGPPHATTAESMVVFPGRAEELLNRA